MPKKVLIVDDMITMRIYERTLLEPEGYQLEEATNGKEALKRIATFRPDLVLMDLLMPEMDGIECCRQIKANPKTREIKVVMVTSKNDKERIERAYAAGCDAYLTKPIFVEGLLEKLRQLLGDGSQPTPRRPHTR